ncbi:MAG: hypothetical protein PHD48_03965 [Alphaproteobacteria bacterium]|nr:hypothetical protein [Alphaproteobacteria bacterium]
MSEKLNKKLKDSIRYTLACYAGNVALSQACPARLKENAVFLREFIRRGDGRDALGCMVENIFLGDANDRRYAAVIRWYEKRHPGTAALILSCLDDLTEVTPLSLIVGRMRHRLHVQPRLGLNRKPSNRLHRIVGR